MKPGAAFFIIVSVIQGYVLWSYAIITPHWTVTPGFPLAEPGRTIRMLSVFLVIAVVFVINFALYKLSAKNDIGRVILNTLISSNIALALTLVLSQILDSTFEMPSPLMYDTLTYVRNNPSVLFVIVVIVNMFAVASSVIAASVLVGINRVTGRSTETDAGAG